MRYKQAFSTSYCPAMRDEIAAELDSLLDSALSEGSVEAQSRHFFGGLRQTRLAQLPLERLGVEQVHKQCFDALMHLSRRSIPLGIGVAMHLYMLAAVATYPFEGSLARQRDLFLRWVARSRALVANSGSDRQGRANNVGKTSTIARPLGGKQYSVSGDKTFMTLAGIADVAVLTVNIERTGAPPQYGFFLANLMSSGALRFGDGLFDGDMTLCSTRSVEMQEFPTRRGHLVCADEKTIMKMHAYQRCWFQTLVPAVFLGAARECLSQAAASARRVPVGGEQFLVDLDGFLLEMGRLDLMWRAAMGLCDQARHSIGKFFDDPKAGYLSESYFDTVLSKYHGLKAAEEIIARTRQLAGTRGLGKDSYFQKAIIQVGYGASFPVVPALFEREAGRQLLATV